VLPTLGQRNNVVDVNHPSEAFPAVVADVKSLGLLSVNPLSASFQFQRGCLLSALAHVLLVGVKSWIPHVVFMSRLGNLGLVLDFVSSPGRLDLWQMPLKVTRPAYFE